MLSWVGVKLIIMVCVLVNVAFITLLERSVLGYIQLRKGPNKLFYGGLLQPMGDALKLFGKELATPLGSNKLMYTVTPILSLVLMLMFWCSTSLDYFYGTSHNYELLSIMVISSLGVYVILSAGWASNSKYAMLGAYRGVAQTISYEVAFSFIVLIIIFGPSSFSLEKIMGFNKEMNFSFMMGVLVLGMWFLAILAETNRTPFDMAEAESELVSGFNVEYGGLFFAFLFMAEYGNILFMSFITTFMFFKGPGVLFWKVIFCSVLFLWFRGTLPRYRYDKMMMLVWKGLLPLVILYLMVQVLIMV